MSGRITIGRITIEPIVEQTLAFVDFRTFFPTLAPELLEANRSWLQPRFLDTTTGKIIIRVQSYLVRTPDHTILVDTCVGNDKHRPARPMWNMLQSAAYHERLAAAGVTVADIDFVMCTHLHVDHVGWNTRLDSGRWVPTFPNARYLFSGRELDYWTKRAATDPASAPWMADSVLPIVEAKREQIVTSSQTFTDDIRLVPTPGHTIDHYSVEVGKPGADALITGDMVHSPIQMKYPELGMMSDYDGRQSGETRRRIFNQCCETSTLLCTAHFPTPSAVRVARDGDGFRCVEA
jgi:glyoxylase-like metal-dependent hydrolase (beta-lactamase superfamily II)